MDALIIQAEGANIEDWETLSRQSTAAGLRLVRQDGVAEGLRRLESESVDALVILLDARLVSEGELGHKITRLARELPVVLLSTRDDPLLVEDLLGLGVQDLLPPQALSAALLAPVVRNAVERHRNASALRLSNRMLGILGSAEPLPERLDQVMALLRLGREDVAAGVRLLDADGRLPLVAASGYDDAFFALAREQVATRGSGACAEVALGRHPGGVFWVNTEGSPVVVRHTQSIRFLRCHGHGDPSCCARFGHSLVCVFPLRQGARVLGVLQVALPSPRLIHGPLVRTLETAAMQLGAAVEHGQVLEAMDLRERRYRALVSAISTAVISLDAEGNMLEKQPEWEAYTGQGMIAEAPRAWLDMVISEDRERLAQLFSQGTPVEGLRQMEARVLCAQTGAHRSCLLRAVPRQGDKGRPWEWIVALTDVQADKEAAQERLELESQLRQAQRMEAVGRLAGGVAHDFNNLLTIIQGNLYLLQAEAPATQTLSEEMQAIGQATARAADLTRQLLAFGRRQVVLPERLDLGQVAVGLEKMLRRVLGEDILLQVRRGEGLLPVLADPGHMEQVVLNLAVHARDAMPRGGALTIDIQNAHHGDRPKGRAPVDLHGPHVLLAVTDSGPALDSETRARIFEPFLASEKAGLHRGLGLAVVYGIVRQHGGQIFVESEEGRGTTFRIYLPAMPERAFRALSPSSGLLRRLTPAAQETVLVVEDEAEVRALVVRILRSYGYRVLAASGGEEALERSRLHQGEIDLVLSDVIMPGRYGPEVVNALLKERPEMAVLYMSGFTDSLVLGESILAEGVAFIEKPFTPDSLAASVKQAIHGS